MLKDDLFIIKKITGGNNVISAIIELNELHEIFKGHFPSQPVLPGACMLQMTREITEIFLNTKLVLSKANDIRFLSLIQPSGIDLEFSIQYNLIENSSVNVSATITVNKGTCYKLKALFKVKTIAI